MAFRVFCCFFSHQSRVVRRIRQPAGLWQSDTRTNLYICSLVFRSQGFPIAPETVSPFRRVLNILARELSTVGNSFLSSDYRRKSVFFHRSSIHIVLALALSLRHSRSSITKISLRDDGSEKKNKKENTSEDIEKERRKQISKPRVYWRGV